MKPPVPPLGSNDLLALARKYRTLASLRRAKRRGEPSATRDELRAIAREFPGALRELDTVRLADLDARATALEASARAERDIAPWMTFLCDYHAWLRAALLVKLRVAHGASLAEGRIEQLAEAASEHSGRPVDVAFVTAVATPERGRMRIVVIDRIAVIHDVSTDEIRAALFPPRVSVDDSADD